MQQGFGRKGIPADAAMAQPRVLPRPAPAPRQPAADGDPYAAMRADFLAQERANAGGENTLAWSTPTSGHSWQKSRLIAYLLWFFLGGFAAHRIYCARYVSAALQVMLGIVAVVLAVASPKDPSVWGWVFFFYALWRLADLLLIPGMCRNPPATY